MGDGSSGCCEGNLLLKFKMEGQSMAEEHKGRRKQAGYVGPQAQEFSEVMITSTVS